ncbi:MAG: FkbM family methyltransferase, partial [Lachnospiraceae bacterium]|nr:FkbM family methyltransferase [Lachnospiraceae bacterium]
EIEDSDIQQIRVPVTTIDDALKECQKAVFFAKIDAESFEYDVVKGMEEVIKKDAPLMLLELSSFDKQAEILEYVNRFHKYRIMYYDYEAEQFTKADLRGSINYFLVPEQGNVYEELKKLILE